MNGLDNIVGRIAADARAQADAILNEGKAQAKAITQQWETQAQAESGAILSQGEKAARERMERLDSMAQMEGKRLLLGTKQELISQAFDKALENLRALPQDEYVELLSKLCAKASVTGREEIIFSPADKAQVGAKVALRANELLGDKGTAALTVSSETRDIQGGFILASDGVEVNCAFDTLVRLSRSQMERQVAQILFGE